MNRPFADYLDQMREHTRHALTLVQGMDKDCFLRDRRTQQAVLMSLLIIGEAAAKVIELYPDIAKGDEGIPWRSMRGMRNRIAHDFVSIDLGIVWATVAFALPTLANTLDGLP